MLPADPGHLGLDCGLATAGRGQVERFVAKGVELGLQRSLLVLASLKVGEDLVAPGPKPLDLDRALLDVPGDPLKPDALLDLPHRCKRHRVEGRAGQGRWGGKLRKTQRCMFEWDD